MTSYAYNLNKKILKTFLSKNVGTRINIDWQTFVIDTLKFYSVSIGHHEQ